LTGYVRNLSDSRSVEVQAEGETGKLEELVQSLHQGPSGAKVEKLEVSWKDYSGDYSSFSIKY
jgi:acylphosphatase